MIHSPFFIAVITTQRGFSHPPGVPGSRREVNEEFQQAKRECRGISVLSFENRGVYFLHSYAGGKINATFVFSSLIFLFVISAA